MSAVTVKKIDRTDVLTKRELYEFLREGMEDVEKNRLHDAEEVFARLEQAICRY